MHYLIAVVSSRSHAEAIFIALVQAGLPMTRIEIIGEGYQTAHSYRRLNASPQRVQASSRLVTWLFFYSFILGYGFDRLTQLVLFPVSRVANHWLAGLLGVAICLLGLYLTDLKLRWMTRVECLLPFEDCLTTGKYLVVFRGTQTLRRQAIYVIQNLEPEALQTYSYQHAYQY